MKVQAARLQASRIYRLTKLMYPDTISFENGQVTVTKYSLFGLGKSEEVVSVSRISSVRVDSAILNSSIVVETQGGSSSDIWVETLPKGPATALADDIVSQLPP